MSFVSSVSEHLLDALDDRGVVGLHALQKLEESCHVRRASDVLAKEGAVLRGHLLSDAVLAVRLRELLADLLKRRGHGLGAILF